MLTGNSFLFVVVQSVNHDSLWPHGLQHARLPCPLSPHLLKLMSIGSVMPFNHLILCHPLLLLPSIFPSIRIFSSESAVRIRWPKCWASASISALSMNVHGWFPLGLSSLISLQSRGLSRVFSSTTFQKYQFFGTRSSLWSNSHIYWGFMVQVCWVLFGSVLTSPGASLMAQMVNNLPVMQETRVQSLGWEDPLEKEMATHSCILA